MIITRSPLRLSLGGGGTDLSSYYEGHEGFLIAAAINQYVYVTVTRPFTPGIYLKYSQLENVETNEEIKHPIIREALKLMNLRTPQIEITTLADIPSGTGLGSSGSFTTALLKALYSHYRKILTPSELAEKACTIEIDQLKEPVGKQDQYIAAFGGVTCFSFHKNGEVSVSPVQIANETLHKLEDNLLLYFTGFSRRSGSILKDQYDKSIKNDKEMINNLHYIKELGIRSKAAIEMGNLSEFAAIMHEHWEHKKKRSSGMSNPKIDEWYDIAMNNGALGGKLVGAGGGGFLLFYVEDKNKVRYAMNKVGLSEVRFKFDFEGTKVVVS